MQIAVCHFLHIHSQHETGDMTEHIFIRLLFTISDKLCCFRLSYLQVSLHHPACRVSNNREDTDTCLERLPSRLIYAPPSSLVFALIFSLTFSIRPKLSILSVFALCLHFFSHTQAFSHRNPQRHTVVITKSHKVCSWGGVGENKGA